MYSGSRASDVPTAVPFLRSSQQPQIICVSFLATLNEIRRQHDKSLHLYAQWYFCRYDLVAMGLSWLFSFSAYREDVILGKIVLYGKSLNSFETRGVDACRNSLSSAMELYFPAADLTITRSWKITLKKLSSIEYKDIFPILPELSFVTVWEIPFCLAERKCGQAE